MKKAEPAIKVGGMRDYDLTVPFATLRTGEEGYHLCFVRGEQKFYVFVGREEMKQLCRRLTELEPNF